MKKEKQETFADLMDSFGRSYDLHHVFDDFLTLALCAFSQNPQTGKSYDEDLYMQTAGRYTKEETTAFAKMLAALILEMEAQTENGICTDVLGGYYETHLYKKGMSQYFTPWPVCMFMATIGADDLNSAQDVPMRILDPCCGSGRMLLAGAALKGKRHEYYGIDLDHTCVKMAAINLFLNGIFHAEVMCADALSPTDFRVSYVISFLPFGVFRITDREQSRLWHLHIEAFYMPGQAKPSDGIQLSDKKGEADTASSQLNLF